MRRCDAVPDSLRLPSYVPQPAGMEASPDDQLFDASLHPDGKSLAFGRHQNKYDL